MGEEVKKWERTLKKLLGVEVVERVGRKTF